MITVRKSDERGHVQHGWLDTYHTFSFASYHDPRFMGFRDLRVINEDVVDEGQGFGKHPHDNMEIVTFVLSGELEHKDSLGTGSVITHGDVQRMSAGKGVVHSEFNHSKEKKVHLFQVWILPDEENIDASYEQKRFEPNTKRDQLRLVVSKGGCEGSVRIHQDVSIYASVLSQNREVNYEFKPIRHGWIQVATGSLSVNGIILEAGDGAQVSNELSLKITAQEDSEFLLFDLK